MGYRGNLIDIANTVHHLGSGVHSGGPQEPPPATLDQMTTRIFTPENNTVLRGRQGERTQMEVPTWYIGPHQTVEMGGVWDGAAGGK